MLSFNAPVNRMENLYRKAIRLPNAKTHLMLTRENRIQLKDKLRKAASENNLHEVIHLCSEVGIDDRYYQKRSCGLYELNLVQEITSGAVN